MEKKAYNIVKDIQTGKLNLYTGIQAILALNAESEIVTSGADAENGTYESVTKQECVADSTQDVQHTRGEALPKRIDDENKCPDCDGIGMVYKSFGAYAKTVRCENCCGRGIL